MASIFLPLRVVLATLLWNILVQGDGDIELGVVIQNELQHVVVQKNSPVLLNCSVTAAPSHEITEIYWTQNDKPLVLDRRINVLENGSLAIQRVIRKKRKKNDEGIYTCFATNDIGTVIGRRVKLQIAYIARHFSVEPQNYESVIGSVARFECKIDAIPLPVYVWEKDERPLPHDESRFTVLPSGVLQITNIRASDAGVYRCRASQGLQHLPSKVDFIHWKISNGGQLVVKEVSGSWAPHFMTNSSTIKAVSTDNVIMECLANGIPRPTITWHFSDEEEIVKDSSVQRIGDGNLKFLDVSVLDSGVYICQANSPGFDIIRQEVDLQVTVEPTFTKVPFSHEYPIAKRIRLQCEANGVPKPSITWFRNGKRIISNSRWKIQDENNVVISNSFVEVSGYYQCLAENSAGMVMATSRINVVLNNDAPRKAESVVANAISSSAIEVKWVSVYVPPCCPLLAYSVHYEEVEIHDEKQVVCRTTETTIQNLKPNTNYTFFVVAYNSEGASPKSDLVRAATKEAVPISAPKIILSSENATSIKITWQQIPEEEKNGVVSKYKIVHQVNGETLVHEEEVAANVTSYILTGLRPDTEYKVRVLGATSVGYPKLSDTQWPWSLMKTGRACPPGEQKSDSTLTVTALNSSAVLICWDVNRDLPITGFRLILHRDASPRGDSLLDITVAADKTAYRLGNLDENTFYELLIMVESEDAVLDVITDVFQTHDPQLPPQPPPPLDIEIVAESSTLRVKWKHPKSSLDISHYSVKYYPLLQDLRVRIEESFSRSHVVEGLSPFVWYRVAVRSHTGLTAGPYSDWVEVQTKEDVPSPPENINYDIISPSEVELQWNPPSKQNGIIIYYIIFYNQDDNQAEVFWKSVMKNGTLTSAVVTDLTDTVYYFKLRAETKAGKGQASPVLKILTDYKDNPRYVEDRKKVKPTALLHDQQLGIILGVTIGLVSIAVCVIIVLFRRRYRYNHIHNPPSGSLTVANGHADNANVPVSTDSVDGADYIFIANRNGGKLNGILQRNGRIPGNPARENGVENPESRALLTAGKPNDITIEPQQNHYEDGQSLSPDFDRVTVDGTSENSCSDELELQVTRPPQGGYCDEVQSRHPPVSLDDSGAPVVLQVLTEENNTGKVADNSSCDSRQTDDDDNSSYHGDDSDNVCNHDDIHTAAQNEGMNSNFEKPQNKSADTETANSVTSAEQNAHSKTLHSVDNSTIQNSMDNDSDHAVKMEATESYLNPVV
ncbi:hypothetical protein ScPMuIL_002897 [Solemya velum]